MSAFRVEKYATSFHTVFMFGLFFDCEAGGDICSSETSVAFQRTIQRYIPEDIPLHLLLLISETKLCPSTEHY
jgi:hypothetical protein